MTDELLKMLKEKAYKKGEFLLSSGILVSTILIVNQLFLVEKD